MIETTHHGSVRARQRGVPPIVLDWLMDYGRVKWRGGADVYYFDHATRKALRRTIGKPVYKRVTDLLDVYAVVSDEGTLITCGWRQGRLKFR